MYNTYYIYIYSYVCMYIYNVATHIYIYIYVDALHFTSCTLRADIRRHIHGRRWKRSPRQGPRVARVLPTLVAEPGKALAPSGPF